MADASPAVRRGSIRLRLLKWLIGPLLLVSLAGGVLSYTLAWLPAQMAYDQGLADAAGTLGARLDVRSEALPDVRTDVRADVLPDVRADARPGVRTDDRPGARGGGAWGIDLPPQAEQVLRSGGVDAVYFVVRDDAGNLVAGDGDFPPLRAGRSSGAKQAYDGVVRGEAVRIATLHIVRGNAGAIIGVAKTLRMRGQIRQAAFRALVLLGSLAALGCIGLAWFSVTNGLLPLERMRRHLNARGSDELEPIPQTDVPYELEPVVHAFNGLLARAKASAQAQQDFLADAAHQLRTPLAGLQAQLEWLAKRHTDPETRHAVELMLSAAERMARRSKQLLALARAEPSRFEKTRMEPLLLDALVGECVQQCVEQAAKKNIDLGFELSPASVLGERYMLHDLIGNLVDNALRYTPANGTVTVRCHQTPWQGSVLEVEDTGPGIPPQLRSAIFDRHVRIDSQPTGSGLGLAIVRDIATVHGASVSVGSGADDAGALFTVRFPA